MYETFCTLLFSFRTGVNGRHDRKPRMFDTVGSRLKIVHYNNTGIHGDWSSFLPSFLCYLDIFPNQLVSHGAALLFSGNLSSNTHITKTTCFIHRSPMYVKVFMQQSPMCESKNEHIINFQPIRKKHVTWLSNCLNLNSVYCRITKKDHFVITGWNEVVAKIIFLHLFVILFMREGMWGVYPSMHCRRSPGGCVSQHALQQVSSGMCIPACLAAGPRGLYYPSMPCSRSLGRGAVCVAFGQ